jgi:hypothetical protein
LDSSAILDWAHWHPRQYLPAFWHVLERRASNGLLVIPDAVRLELKDDPGVNEWLNTLPKSVFWQPTTDDLREAAAIALLFPALAAVPAHPTRADAQVIQAGRAFDAAVICSERTSMIAVTGVGPFPKSQKMDAACVYYRLQVHTGQETLTDVLATHSST